MGESSFSFALHVYMCFTCVQSPHSERVSRKDRPDSRLLGASELCRSSPSRLLVLASRWTPSPTEQVALWQPRNPTPRTLSALFWRQARELDDEIHVSYIDKACIQTATEIPVPTFTSAVSPSSRSPRHFDAARGSKGLCYQLPPSKHVSPRSV